MICIHNKEWQDVSVPGSLCAFRGTSKRVRSGASGGATSQHHHDGAQVHRYWKSHLVNLDTCECMQMAPTQHPFFSFDTTLDTTQLDR
eukprot:4960680-Pleurochrysis_carterae.AAC.1